MAAGARFGAIATVCKCSADGLNGKKLATRCGSASGYAKAKDATQRSQRKSKATAHGQDGLPVPAALVAGFKGVEAAL